MGSLLRRKPLIPTSCPLATANGTANELRGPLTDRRRTGRSPQWGAVGARFPRAGAVAHSPRSIPTGDGRSIRSGCQVRTSRQQKWDFHFPNPSDKASRLIRAYRPPIEVTWASAPASDPIGCDLCTSSASFSASPMGSAAGYHMRFRSLFGPGICAAWSCGRATPGRRRTRECATAHARGTTHAYRLCLGAAYNRHRRSLEIA